MDQLAPVRPGDTQVECIKSSRAFISHIAALFHARHFLRGCCDGSSVFGMRGEADDIA